MLSQTCLFVAATSVWKLRLPEHLELQPGVLPTQLGSSGLWAGGPPTLNPHTHTLSFHWSSAHLAEVGDDHPMSFIWVRWRNRRRRERIRKDIRGHTCSVHSSVLSGGWLIQNKHDGHPWQFAFFTEQNDSLPWVKFPPVPFYPAASWVLIKTIFVCNCYTSRPDPPPHLLPSPF